jgi:hypothetical protein
MKARTVTIKKLHKTDEVVRGAVRAPVRVTNRGTVAALRHGFSEIHTHDEHQRKAAAAVGLTPIAIR